MSDSGEPALAVTKARTGHRDVRQFYLASRGLPAKRERGSSGFGTASAAVPYSANVKVSVKVLDIKSGGSDRGYGRNRLFYGRP